MLEFAVKEDYDISPNSYGAEVGFDVDLIRALRLLNFSAVGDGRLIIYARIAKKDFEYQSDKSFLFDLSNSKTAARNISGELGVVEDLAYDPHNAWRVSRVGTSLLFTRGADAAKLFPDFGAGEPVAIAITNSLPKLANRAGYSVDLRPDAYQRVIGEGNLLPMPITDGSLTQYICFLEVDTENRTAAWVPLPELGDGGAKRKRFKFWGKSKTRPDGDLVLKVSSLNFLQGEARNLALQNPMLRGHRVSIVSNGVKDGTFARWGFPLSVVAEIDRAGNIISKPFFQDHRRHQDEKKRGHTGLFTSSKKYCILKSIYRKADEWKGKQRVLDLDAGHLMEIKLPRGYTKYEMVDHCGEDFWFKETQGPGNQTGTKIIRCEIA